jgi:hypothetical protein
MVNINIGGVPTNCFLSFFGTISLKTISIDLSQMTNGILMFNGATLNTDVWSDLLVATEDNNCNNNVTWSGGNSKHNAAGAVALSALVVDQGWTITDGGLE